MNENSTDLGKNSFTRVEFGPNFFDGDYSKVGYFIYISHFNINKYGSLENAFEAQTIFKRENIVNYSLDDVFDEYHDLITGNE